MISWGWLLLAFLLGGVLGFFALALCVAGSNADEWVKGYRAGQKSKEGEK